MRSDIELPNNWEHDLGEVIKLGLEFVGAPDSCEISISFVTAIEMQELNKIYRQLDTKTDVLSFPFLEGPPQVQNHEGLQWESGGPPMALGDIVICADLAREQAEKYGHTFIRELSFLTIHGLLHLFGYDHETPDDEKLMIEAQDNVLTKAGLAR